jgi:hypothetical protein
MPRNAFAGPTKLLSDEQRETLLEIARLWTQMELSSADPNGVDGAAQVLRFPEVPKS